MDCDVALHINLPREIKKPRFYMPHSNRSRSSLQNTQFNLLFKLTFAILFFFSSMASFAQSVEEGEKLFKQNCASCHHVDARKAVGPGLAGVFDRVPQPAEDWLIRWIKNSQALVKAGDAYAVKIFEEYNKSVMPAQALSDDQIKSVLAYIQNPPVKGPAAGAPAAAAAKAPSTSSETITYILFGLIIIFLILINVLGGVKKSLARLIREKEGLPEPVELPFNLAAKNWVKNNKKLVAVGMLVLVSIGAKAAWDSMFEIGVYTGYMPEQPIFFSHKIHAGENGVNCVYCHSGVEKSKISNIPSANVCMNCHKYIQEGTITGKDEIAKIYAALDYNPESGEYGDNPKPIKWVKVHPLPEHVYFNHAQHVTVGKQECATCHGPVEKMDTLYQYSPLTMRWCIDCHRTTNVAMDGNPYYTELHSKLAAQYKGKQFTVDKIGGIECGKCHY
jgi:mono/diheme cytochrome c family protein